MLAVQPDRPAGALFTTLRLNGVVCIAVTGIVYHLSENGYGRVLLNCLLVAVLFLALAAGATYLDRRLRRKTTVER